jgi:hypothetical protein
LEEVIKAYLAGIVDGEGTITLTKHHKNETPAPLVSVSNNDLQLLRWIQGKVGGVITSKRKNKPHHSNSYVWCLRQDKALWLLSKIKHYLIVKRKQAELILQEYKKVTHRAGKYTADLLHEKEKLVSKIRLLNQR